jgi:hypothetical protein
MLAIAHNGRDLAVTADAAFFLSNAAGKKPWNPGFDETLLNHAR